MEQDHETFWAIIEIMGHKTLAGELHPVELAGAGFLRIDIPATRSVQAWSKYLSTASIYGITPVDEQIARSVAEDLQERPLTLYSAGDLGRDLMREARQQLEMSLPQHKHDGPDDEYPL